MKEKIRVTGGWTKLLLLTMLVWLLTGIGAFAAETAVTVRLDGIQDYDQAKQVYELVNQERAKAGAGTLVWDAQLTQDAMQRAAELAISFSHTRPDGTICFTAVTNSFWSVGENIAIYQSDASSVMNSWMNSSGHRDNILDTSYREIGIGSFYHNGHYYWVQLFTSGTHAANTRTGKSQVTASVKTLLSGLNLRLSSEVSGSALEQEQLTYRVLNTNAEWGYAYAVLRPEEFTWSSSNTAVAQIHGSGGTVTTVGTGTAQITASLGGKSASASLTVIHNPGEWVTVKEATCAETGTRTRSCTKCGQLLETETLPKTEDHSFGPFTVTTEATVFQEGVKTRVCRICGCTQDRPVARLKATAKLAQTKLTIQVQQTVSAPEVTMKNGDSIAGWKSSRTSVATVSSKGEITGRKAGTAKITVTLKSGKKASLTVTVKKVRTTKLKINKKSLTLKAGKTYTLKTSVTPENSQDKLIFKSSNKKVASVSSQGKITAKKKGTVKITVQSGSKKAVCTVKVK